MTTLKAHLKAIKEIAPIFLALMVFAAIYQAVVSQ